MQHPQGMSYRELTDQPSVFASIYEVYATENRQRPFDELCDRNKSVVQLDPLPLSSPEGKRILISTLPGPYSEVTIHEIQSIWPPLSMSRRLAPNFLLCDRNRSLWIMRVC